MGKYFEAVYLVDFTLLMADFSTIGKPHLCTFRTTLQFINAILFGDTLRLKLKVPQYLMCPFFIHINVNTYNFAKSTFWSLFLVECVDTLSIVFMKQKLVH